MTSALILCVCKTRAVFRRQMHCHSSSRRQMPWHLSSGRHLPWLPTSVRHALHPEGKHLATTRLEAYAVAAAFGRMIPWRSVLRRTVSWQVSSELSRLCPKRLVRLDHPNAQDPIFFFLMDVANTMLLARPCIHCLHAEQILLYPDYRVLVSSHLHATISAKDSQPCYQVQYIRFHIHHAYELHQLRLHWRSWWLKIDIGLCINHCRRCCYLACL